MASRLIEAGLKPDRILCSSAVRTKETAEHFIDAQAVESNSVHFEQSLYLASPGTMLSLIEGTDNAVRHLMIIAHNPGLEVLGRQLHPGAPVNLPTCGMLHFQLHQEDFILSTGTEIEMVFYDFPKNRAD